LLTPIRPEARRLTSSTASGRCHSRKCAVGSAPHLDPLPAPSGERKANPVSDLLLGHSDTVPPKVPLSLRLRKGRARCPHRAASFSQGFRRIRRAEDSPPYLNSTAVHPSREGTCARRSASCRFPFWEG